MAKKPNEDQFSITLDKELHKKFKEYCKRQSRSKVKQLAFMIKQVVEEDEANRQKQ